MTSWGEESQVASSWEESQVTLCTHTLLQKNDPSFQFKDIRTVEPMLREIIHHVTRGVYRRPQRTSMFPLFPRRDPLSPTNQLVVVEGWHGVGSGTLLQYATPRIEEALKRFKQHENIWYGFHIVEVNIAKEERSGASAAAKIRQVLEGDEGGLSQWREGSYLIVIVNSSGPLQEISLRGLFPHPTLLSTFIIQALQVDCSINPTHIKAVKAAFDTLSDEEALWLLRREAQCVADAVCQRRHRGRVAPHDRRPLSTTTLVNGSMALECFLYCTLVTYDLFDPGHCWMAEGLLEGDDGLEYYSPEAERLAHDLMTEFQDRCMLQIFDPYGYIVRVEWPLLSKVISAFSLTEEQWGQGVISKHSSNLTEFPHIVVEERGRKAKDVRRISLANNCIRQLIIPAPGLSDYFPNLCTLLLHDNPLLEEIPDNVFSPKMPNLRLLDLSGTSIAKLPSSLSNCVNLRMLSLNGCPKLETLFPIFDTCLDHLEVLSLQCTPLNNITNLSIPYRPNLKVLRFFSAFDKLEEFNISVNNGSVFEECLAPRRRDWYWTAPIKNAHIIVSHPEDARTRERKNLIQEKFPLYKSVLEQIESNVYPRPVDIDTSYNRRLEIHGGHENVLGYNIAHSICFPDFISLCDSQVDVPIKLDDFKELKSCRIERCRQMTTAFSLGIEETQLENIHLSYLGRIKCICQSIDGIGTLAHLRNIRIEVCNNLLVLFMGSGVKLPMLEELEIKFCAKFQSVFGEEIDCSRARGESNLPKLQRLHLCELPNMTTICDGYLPSVQALKVRGCSKLRKLPLATIAIDATTDPIVKVIQVEGEQAWWNSVVGNEVFHKTKINFVTPF